MTRLAAGVAVSALLRQVAAAGGAGMVLARGDATAGAILVVLTERGRAVAMRERRTMDDGRSSWPTAGPGDGADQADIDAYVARRRTVDDDLWVIELDIAGVERFAEEHLATD